VARKGGRTVVRYVKSKSKGRRPRKNDLKKYAKKLAIGAASGLAVSIPLTLLARYTNHPELMEVGQRGGSIVSASLGGGLGNAGYQIGDAIFDRFVFSNGNIVSGTQGGQTYL